MGNLTNQSSTNIPNKRNGTLANASLIIGVLGFVLPYLVFYLLVKFAGYIDVYYLRGDFTNSDLLSAYIPIAFSIAGPIAIIIGRQVLKSHDNILKIWKIKATVGIVLGILTIVFDLLPLLLYLAILNGCEHGC